MLAEKSVSIRKAYRILQGISRDKRKRIEYEAREKAIRDQKQMMQEALEEGRSKGIEIGKIEVAKNLIASHADEDDIRAWTGLSSEQIAALKK